MKNKPIYRRHKITRHSWKIIRKEIYMLLAVSIALIAIEYALDTIAVIARTHYGL